MPDPSEQIQESATFDGMKLTMLLMKHKLFIILFTVITTGIAAGIAFFLPNEFMATVSVVPPKTSSSMFESAMSNVSSALRDIGLTKLGSGQVEGYTFMVILQSRSVIDSMITKFKLKSRYDVDEPNPDLVREMFWENISITIEKAGNYTISIWDKNRDTAALMANSFVEFANKKAQDLSQTEAGMNRVYIEQRLAITEIMIASIADTLSQFSGRNLLFSPEDQAKALSSALAELKSKNIESEIYYELFKNTYGDGDPYTEYYKNLQNQLKSQISDVEQKPGFAGNFAMKDAAGIGIKYLKLYTEYETYAKVKAFLMPMLEKAKLDEQRNSQNVFVVDEAVPPFKKDRPKRSVIIAGAGVGGLVLSIIIVVIIYNFRNFKSKYKEFSNT